MAKQTEEALFRRQSNVNQQLLEHSAKLFLEVKFTFYLHEFSISVQSARELHPFSAVALFRRVSIQTVQLWQIR